LAEIPEEVRAEQKNVEQALSLLEEAMSRKRKTAVELSAMGACLHNVYNGMENIIKQLMKIRGITIPQSPTWHKDLLNHGITSGIIPHDLGDTLFQYLGFRHFFAHAYGFMLDKDHIDELARNLPAVWKRFVSAIDNACR
jgi:uncharacterized protein YutE (UPF0331/DUF86 family)